MALCPSCGGVIGRDCYDPADCEMISNSLSSVDVESNERVIAALKDAKEIIEFADKHFDCPPHLVETWGNLIMNGLSIIEDVLNSKGVAVQKIPSTVDIDDLPF